MKLVTAIVQDKDATKLSNAFVKANIRATRLTTTGGFLRSGNTTFLIAIEDARVQETLDIIQEVSQTRKQFMVPQVNLDAGGEQIGIYPIEVEVGGATVYTQNIESFHQF